MNHAEKTESPGGGRTGVLFVCLGNICRSPLAEGVFIHLAHERGVLERFDVDSCGTGHWHVGKRADPRSLEVAERHGVHLPSVARQVDPDEDFERFDWLIAMDRANRNHLIDRGADRQRVHLLRSFDPAMSGKPHGELDVPDPYWDDDGFEQVFEMVRAGCEGLLERLAGQD